MNKQELLKEIEATHQELAQPGVVAPYDSTLSKAAMKYFDAIPIKISATLELYILKDKTLVLHPLIDGWWLLENPQAEECTFVSTSACYIGVTDYPPAYVVAMVTI